MFGTYRTILALFVMIGHLFGPYQLGIYSVFGFYTLSGYLMTLVMQTSYGYTADGFRRFLFNRFLRIYPSYYAAIGFSVLLLLIFKEEVTQFKQNIFLPSKLEEYFHNLLIIFPRDTLLRLSPASWALTIEIFFYMCICFGLSRNKQRSIVWFVISLVITVYLLIFSKSWQDRYYTIAAASLPFSIGALIYHNCSCFKKVLEVLRIKSPIFWLVLMVFNFTLAFILEYKVELPLLFTYGFYLNLIIVSGCLVALSDYQSQYLSKRMDAAFGDFSYPIYLIHWQCGAIIYCLSESTWKPAFLTGDGLIFLISSVGTAFIISAFMIYLIDKPIQQFRTKIKSRKLSK